MSEYTPGPWFVTEDGTMTGHHFVVTTDEHSDDFTEREDVAEISLPSWTKPNGLRGKKDQRHRAEAEANARLIAAAPDLLEALKAVVAVAGRGTVEFDRARAAIAKAEGKP